MSGKKTLTSEMKEKIESVLLVDDDSITNFINERLIKKLNITEEVKISVNGREALKYIHEASQSSSCPELIFLDINMPVMNGLEFLQSYSQGSYCEKKPIIIILSSSSNRHDFDELNKYPSVCGFVDKPLTEEKVKFILKEYFA